MADYTAYELGNILRRLEKKVDAALCCCESLELKNLGLGVPIYVGRFKNYLKIRSLVAGTNMNITYDNNTITFDSLAGGFTCSDLNSCSTSNLPEGSNLYYTNARVLSYMTGQNISIFTNDSGYITAASLPTVGTWGALNYPTWVSGTPFVKMTAAGTFALDTNTYLTSAVTSLNGLTDATQLFSSTDLGITSVTGTHTFTIATNAVTDAKLRQSAGLSLVGRSTNSIGDVADITALTANSSLRLNPAGTALAFSTAPLSVLISNHNTTAVLSSTNYIQITGAVSAVGVGSIGSRQTAFPIGATAQNMYIKTNTAQSATGSLVISLTIATTPSALSITIAAGSALGTFSNTLSAVTIAAGNLLTYEIKNNATATSATVVTISTCFY